MTSGLNILLLGGRWAIVRIAGSEPIPSWAHTGPFYSITRSTAETSVVCPEGAIPAGFAGAPIERGFRVLRVAGTLEFSMVGVLASIASPLAAARVSILAISTFDTDYLLIREPDLARAVAALGAAGHRVAGT